MGKSLENHRKMVVLRENHRKIIGKWWFYPLVNIQTTDGKITIDFVKFPMKNDDDLDY